MTGYVLDPDSPAALRGDGGRQRQRQALQQGAASQQALLKARVLKPCALKTDA